MGGLGIDISRLERPHGDARQRGAFCQELPAVGMAVRTHQCLLGAHNEMPSSACQSLNGGQCGQRKGPSELECCKRLDGSRAARNDATYCFTPPQAVPRCPLLVVAVLAVQIQRPLRCTDFKEIPRARPEFGVYKVDVQPLLNTSRTEARHTNYAIYGVFSFCPDCGSHNSLRILRKNIEVISIGSVGQLKRGP